MFAFVLFHTAVSVLAVPLGLLAFVRDGRIDPQNRVGKLYLAAMLVGSVSAFGFILTKGFNPAQVLTVATLMLLSVGAFADRTKWLGRAGAYVEAFSLSASYLLLMVFTTTETLVRVPVGHPFAANAESPQLLPVRLALLAAFVLGYGYQVFELHLARKNHVQLSTEFVSS
jgi:uncharacterized membrane protein